MIILLIVIHVLCFGDIRGTPDEFPGHKLSYVDASDDVLEYPYKSSQTRRYKRDCTHYRSGNQLNSTVPAHGGNKQDRDTDADIVTLPIIEDHHTTVTFDRSGPNEKNVLLHVAYVNNPEKTLSVYEPLHDGTCRKYNGTRAEVTESAETRHCLLATNAGFFNTTTGACYGNIVSDGRLIQDSHGIYNAHFGITRTGKLFFGYLSELELMKNDFIQLVGGVIWVLKDGDVHVNKSIASECRDTEETGTLQRFSSVVSARTLVGNDKYGRVMIVQIEGKTDRNGVNLYEGAMIMKDLGAINAINLDGGGSSTFVINGTLVNYPSDFCGKFQCARPVTTILCVHKPYCKTQDCGGHGSCDLGVCRCHSNWRGDNCDVLECPGNCTGHGVCTEAGCDCIPGYHGEDCSTLYPDGCYGNQCKQPCHCEINASWDSVIPSLAVVLMCAVGVLAL